MAKGVRVKLNADVWGKNVMSSGAVADFVESEAYEAAKTLGGEGEVQMIELPARRGGSRIRARVSHGTNHFQEANTNALVRAVSAVVPLGRS